MENLLTRHRNVTILVAVLFAEVIGLAVQVKRTSDTDSTRLIRIWTVSAVTPLEKAFAATQQGISDAWHNYFYLRGVRAQNRKLQDEIEQLRLQQVRLAEDAGQARRLQRLLGFKEQFIAKTMPAQVIGSSGSDVSRVVYIDKGEGDGIKQDMAVITADGVVGKVLSVFPTSSQVLLINDPSSGVGVILEKSRLQGVLKGTPSGELVLDKMMTDERIEPGDQLLTSGGDQIFPKGLPIGTVKSVSPAKDIFLTIRVKPAAHLNRLEEVLVITQVEKRPPTVDETRTALRAVDILAARLPSVPENQEGRATGEPLPIGARPPASTAKTGTEKAASGGKLAKPGPGAEAKNVIAPKARAKAGETAEGKLANSSSGSAAAKQSQGARAAVPAAEASTPGNPSSPVPAGKAVKKVHQGALPAGANGQAAASSAKQSPMVPRLNANGPAAAAKSKTATPAKPKTPPATPPSTNLSPRETPQP